MEKEIKTVWLGLLILLVIFSYIDFQQESYWRWVKNRAIEDYEACRIFNEGKEGEEYCLEYAKGDQFSPYPFWEALILINPNK